MASGLGLHYLPTSRKKDARLIWVNPLRIRNPQTGTLVKVQNSDKLAHSAAFHQGIHYLVKLNQSSEKKNVFLKAITCDHLLEIMDHFDITLSNCMRNAIGTKGLRLESLLKQQPKRV